MIIIRIKKNTIDILKDITKLTTLLLLLLVVLFIYMHINKTEVVPIEDDGISDEVAQMTEDELQQKLYENAIAVQYMENYTGEEGYKIYKCKNDTTFKADEFSSSVVSLLYNESDAIKNLNYEVLTKWAKDDNFNVSEITAVGSEFAQDAYGIAHYTYVSPTAVGRVFFVIDLQSRLAKGYLEVTVGDEE